MGFSGGRSGSVAESDIFICREKTCCFSGHRNRDLPFGGDRTVLGMRNLVSTIQLAIETAASQGCDTFISGMADGIDLICAESVHDMIEHGRRVKLICALPYKDQFKEMTSSRDWYIYRMLTAKYPCVTVSVGYDRGCYRLRNSFMVEHSSKLIAVLRHKETGSGTLQTVRMAAKAGLDMHVIKLDEKHNPAFFIGNADHI
jgi:uncharacterized phage-like protein YoqJ